HAVPFRSTIPVSEVPHAPCCSIKSGQPPRTRLPSAAPLCFLAVPGSGNPTSKPAMHLPGSRAESMLYRRLCSLLAALTLLTVLLPSARCQDFSIIVLPDTQNEAQFFPSVLDSQ